MWVCSLGYSVDSEQNESRQVAGRPYNRANTVFHARRHRVPDMAYPTWQLAALGGRACAGFKSVHFLH